MDIIVIAVNNSSFNDNFFKLDENIKLLNTHNCLSLPEKECIELSGNITKSLSYADRPYSIDFPDYYSIDANIDILNKLIDNDHWECNKVSTPNKDKHNKGYTLTPNELFLDLLYIFY